MFPAPGMNLMMQTGQVMFRYNAGSASQMGPWLPSFRQVNSKLGASFSSLLTMAPLICSSKQWEIQANLIGFTQASPNQQCSATCAI